MLPSRPFCVLPAWQRGDVEVVLADAVRQRDRALVDPEQTAEELAHVAVAVDGDDRAVGHAQGGLHERADPPDLAAPGRGAVGRARRRQQRDELVELVGDDGGVVGERVA